MADILSPADFAIVSKMANDQGLGQACYVKWAQDGQYLVPTVITKTGKTLAVHLLPDGAGGWRKMYRKRGASNGVA
jgi:hypothetical protein